MDETLRTNRETWARQGASVNAGDDDPRAMYGHFSACFRLTPLRSAQSAI